MFSGFFDSIFYLVQTNLQAFISHLALPEKVGFVQNQAQLLFQLSQGLVSQGYTLASNFIVLQQQIALAQFTPVINQYNKIIAILDILKR